MEEPTQSGEAAYYKRLETGARWLASRAGGSERDSHLGHADRYARLGLDASQGGF